MDPKQNEFFLLGLGSEYPLLSSQKSTKIYLWESVGHAVLWMGVVNNMISVLLV